MLWATKTAKAPIKESLRNPSDSCRENSFNSRFIADASTESNKTATAASDAPQTVTSNKLAHFRSIELFKDLLLNPEHFFLFLGFRVIKSEQVQ